MTTRVLIIGQGLFCEGLTRLLSDDPTLIIVGAVENCNQVAIIDQESNPDIVIVDKSQDYLNQNELNSLLEKLNTVKFVYLTLSDNNMVVHHRQQLTNVTLPVLLDALKSERSKPRLEAMV